MWPKYIKFSWKLQSILIRAIDDLKEEQERAKSMMKMSSTIAALRDFVLENEAEVSYSVITYTVCNNIIQLKAFDM